MPKTILEAMACGCICLGTDVEGINEGIDQDCGYLIPYTSSVSINNTLTQMETEKKYFQEKSISARNKIIKKYSIDVIVTKEKELMQLL